MSTPAVRDGLVYIPDENSYVYCLDATTGKAAAMASTITLAITSRRPDFPPKSSAR
jgi:outer membrane protein assembly factor BamB